MRISCIQLDMVFCEVDKNFAKVEVLIRFAVAKDHPDAVVLPETWSTGYFPKTDKELYCQHDADISKKFFSTLAKELNINIVSGSIMNFRHGNIYNTALVFDRSGACVAEYDKTHLFTPMGEHEHFCFGDHISTFILDGEKCGIIICYDIRFPEFIRTMALDGIQMLFSVSQWPDKRIMHLNVLARARAIENQMYIACCNSCGIADGTKFGGNSSVIGPWGEILAHAEDKEQIITADCDFSIINDIRNSINVFNDRKPKLYKLN